MPKEKSLEFKVGFFVLLALIGLAVFIFSITDSPIFEGARRSRRFLVSPTA